MGYGEDTSTILRSIAEKQANRPTPTLEELRPRQEPPAETHNHPDTKGAAQTPFLERLLAQATQEAQDKHAIGTLRKTIGELQAESGTTPEGGKRGIQKLLHTAGEQSGDEKIAPVVKAFLNGEAPGKVFSK